ncbi:MAG: D-aminoacyl-tRNA deacylase, partial [candidate division NC10 bacterium]|nr:D-aminoacyl-tRNA deacylase [candidate division NC10 bacterium]
MIGPANTQHLTPVTLLTAEADSRLLTDDGWSEAEMRAVIQRVRRAQVIIDGGAVGQIGLGLVVFLGVGKEDGQEEVDWMVEKIAHL